MERYSDCQACADDAIDVLVAERQRLATLISTTDWHFHVRSVLEHRLELIDDVLELLGKVA